MATLVLIAVETVEKSGGEFGRIGPVFIVVGLILLAVFLGRLRRRGASSAGQRSEPAGFARGDKPDVERDQTARGMILDLEEAGRKVSARLDTRIRALELLLEEANEKIARLEALQGAAASAQDGEGSPPDKPAARTEPSSSGLPAVHQRVCDLADRGLEPVGIARETGLPRGEVDLILGLRRSVEKQAE